MFDYQSNGYNISQVKEYINTLKTDYERKLMNLQVKVLESERKLLSMQAKNPLDSAVEKARQIEASSRNIYELKYKQLTILDSKLAVVLKEIARQYPGIDKNVIIKQALLDFNTAMYTTTRMAEDDITAPAGTDNDSIRALLSKIQKRQEEPKDLRESIKEAREVKIERRPYDSNVGKNMIKPIADVPIDKFLATRVEEKKQIFQSKSESGFDLKEALMPTENLEEIMKAFDFYNDKDKGSVNFNFRDDDEE